MLILCVHTFQIGDVSALVFAQQEVGGGAHIHLEDDKTLGGDESVLKELGQGKEAVVAPALANLKMRRKHARYEL